MARRRAQYGELIGRIEAAAYLGVSVRTLDRYRRLGHLRYALIVSTPPGSPGGQYYKLADLNAFLRRRERAR